MERIGKCEGCDRKATSKKMGLCADCYANAERVAQALKGYQEAPSYEVFHNGRLMTPGPAYCADYELKDDAIKFEFKLRRGDVISMVSFGDSGKRYRRTVHVPQSVPADEEISGEVLTAWSK